MTRKPCVAGRFYPGTKATLSESLGSLLAECQKEDAVAIIAPHAGYIYSGGVAGFVYSSVNMPDKVVLIGPNHTGLGADAAVMASGEWEIPTGTVRIDEGLADAILNASGLFKEDIEAHLMEHSLEVQLPFIHALNPEAEIVPITVMRAGVEECRELGEAIAKAISSCDERVLIAVSSDMNHYEPDAVTRKKDRLAIDRVLALDASGLLETARKKDITMCGVVPSAIAIFAAKALGAKGGSLIKYATSGETSGDHDQVVGYAGIIIK